MRIEDLRLPPSNRLDLYFMIAQDSGASVLTTSGAYVFALTTAMLTTLKLSITIEEK